MKVIMLNGDRFTSKQAAHKYIAEALHFPAHYGGNLDALADCLSELPKNTAVVLSGLSAAKAHIGDYAEDIADTFRDVLGRKNRFILI